MIDNSCYPFYPNIKDSHFAIESFETICKNDIKNRASLPHRMPSHGILFFTDGQSKHHIDFKEFDVQKGNALFISQGQLHIFENIRNDHGYIILFDDSFLINHTSESELESIKRLFNYEVFHPLIESNFNQYSSLYNIVFEMLDENNSRDDKYKIPILRNLLKLFLLKAERLRTEYKNPYHSKYYKEFITFQHLLSEYVNKDRSVQFYADKLGYSTKKLNTITHEIIGESAKTYISSRIILEVKRLLVCSEKTVRELCDAYGFDEATNFIKFFKKYTGQTPQSFRSESRGTI